MAPKGSYINPAECKACRWVGCNQNLILNITEFWDEIDKKFPARTELGLIYMSVDIS